MKFNKLVNSLKDGTVFFYVKRKLTRFKYKNNYEIVNDLNSLDFLKKHYGKFLSKLPILEESNEDKEKIIWWCWLQGEKQAPELCKKCLTSLRNNYPDYKIVVITIDNLYEYVNFPTYIKEKYNKGIITHTHFSDLIRTQLLIEYGGTWIDSSVYCTGKSEMIEKSSFFVYKSFLNPNKSMSASSWLISSKKNNPILIATRDLLFEYWKNKNSLINYFLFHIFFTMAREKYDDLWKKVINIPNSNPHILQFELLDMYSFERINYIKSLSDFHKLSQKAEVELDDVNGSYYYKIMKGEEL